MTSRRDRNLTATIFTIVIIFVIINVLTCIAVAKYVERKVLASIPDKTPIDAAAVWEVGASVFENTRYANVAIEAKTINQETAEGGNGSGFVVSSKGYVISNAHVISYTDENGVDVAHESIFASFCGEATRYELEVVCFNSDLDLAVLRFKFNPEKMTYVNLASGNTLKFGQLVFAIGNAEGDGISFTGGYVSSVSKIITLNNGRTAHVLQTDAALNPGNSGGALYDVHGKVVGVNTYKYSGSEAMGFAIHADTVRAYLDSEDIIL